METLLIGTGKMGKAYAAALQSLDVPFFAIGRNLASAVAFEASTGAASFSGGVERWPRSMGLPTTAIVAVPGLHLADTARALAARGVKRILLEKPGARDPEELRELGESLPEGCEIAIALNRRFLPSFEKLAECVERDGGPRKIEFEFGEPIDRLVALDHPPEILSRWVFHNACHVADLAFSIGGYPRDLEAVVCGSTPWHPDGSAFIGSGSTHRGVPFSFRADWETPGNWKLEIETDESRYRLAPLERLIRVPDGADITPPPLPRDRSLKPGLARQLEAFFSRDADRLQWLHRGGPLPAYARWAEAIYARALVPSKSTATSARRFTRSEATRPWL